MQYCRRRKEVWYRPSWYQGCCTFIKVGSTLSYAERHARSYVSQCQKCQKGIQGAFGTFGTPSVSVFGETHALLWEARVECPETLPVLVGHDEIVVECDAEQALDAKVWLQKAMIEGMDAVMNGTDQMDVPLEVEARIVRGWGEGS
jgi:hypothetical protein